MKSRSCKVPMNFPWPNVKISIQDIFAILKPATKKNIFIERENKQANKRWVFAESEVLFSFVYKTFSSQNKKNHATLGPHLRNDKNKNIREHFDSLSIHISI